MRIHDFRAITEDISPGPIDITTITGAVFPRQAWRRVNEGVIALRSWNPKEAKRTHYLAVSQVAMVSPSGVFDGARA